MPTRHRKTCGAWLIRWKTGVAPGVARKALLGAIQCNLAHRKSLMTPNGRGGQETKKTLGNRTLPSVSLQRRARGSNPQPLAGHHISSCPARCSTTVHERPKPYTVAGLGRRPKSETVRHCSPESAPLATKWLHAQA